MHGVSGIVLAGGLGRRMGGVDKGLQPLRGKAMVEHVLARLAPQVDEIVINANQNLERYSAFGHRVFEPISKTSGTISCGSKILFLADSRQPS